MGTTPPFDPDNANLMSVSSMEGADVDIGKDEYPRIEQDDSVPFVPDTGRDPINGSGALKERLKHMPYRDRSGG